MTKDLKNLILQEVFDLINEAIEKYNIAICKEISSDRIKICVEADLLLNKAKNWLNQLYKENEE